MTQENTNQRGDLLQSMLHLQRMYMESVRQMTHSLGEVARFNMTTLSEVMRLGTSGAVTSGRTTTETKQGAAEQSIEVAEEVLEVGKSRVMGATTRVRRVLHEVPVRQVVELVDETVVVERIPAGQDEAGVDSFSEREYIMQDSREVAVVNKRNKVRERVVLRREQTRRVETIKDTVKKTDVEVEQPRQMAIVNR